MQVSDARKPHKLKAENSKLTLIVVEQMLEMTAMRELLAKN